MGWLRNEDQWRSRLVGEQGAGRTGSLGNEFRQRKGQCGRALRKGALGAEDVQRGRLVAEQSSRVGSFGAERSSRQEGLTTVPSILISGVTCSHSLKKTHASPSSPSRRAFFCRIFFTEAQDVGQGRGR